MKLLIGKLNKKEPNDDNLTAAYKELLSECYADPSSARKNDSLKFRSVHIMYCKQKRGPSYISKGRSKGAGRPKVKVRKGRGGQGILTGHPIGN